MRHVAERQEAYLILSLSRYLVFLSNFRTPISEHLRCLQRNPHSHPQEWTDLRLTSLPSSAGPLVQRSGSQSWFSYSSQPAVCSTSITSEKGGFVRTYSGQSHTDHSSQYGGRLTEIGPPEYRRGCCRRNLRGLRKPRSGARWRRSRRLEPL